MALIHATCVALEKTGVLIRGPSGAGKSDLALRLIDGGARLVADDYCEAEAKFDHLIVTVPATIAGKIEMRGFGILTLPFHPEISVGLVVDLLPEAEIPRMPDQPTCTIEGVTLPRLYVNAFAASAAAKVRIVLSALLLNATAHRP